jgi:hypothetical protein
VADRSIQSIFGGEKSFGLCAMFPPQAINRANVSPRAESTPADGINQNSVNGVILCPTLKRVAHGGTHFMRQCVKRIRPI